MAEQYRPINEYVEDMVDPEELQMQALRTQEPEEIPDYFEDYQGIDDLEIARERAQDFFKNPESFKRVADEWQTQANIKQALSDPMLTWDQNESLASNEYTWDILNEASDDVQWWQYMWNHADHIKSDTYKAEKKRSEVEKERLEKLKTLELAKPEDERNLEALKEFDSDIKSLESDIEESEKDISSIQKDIAKRNQTSFSYKLRAQAGLSDEATNLIDYWGSPESAEDIGGAMSDRKLMAAQMAMGVGGAALAAATVMNGWNPVGWALAGTLALGAGSVGLQIPMRDNESKAEMYGAYEERMRILEENYATEYGKTASGDNLKKLEEDAWKGAEAVYAKNMTLLAGDALQITAAFVPMFTAFKPFGTATSFFSSAARTLGNVGVKYGSAFALNSIVEGFEEAYQYDIKERYKHGYFDDLDSESNWKSAFIGSGGIAGEAAGGMLGMFSHRHVGRTNTQEFRNAVRAGAVLGLGLGAASSVAMGVGGKTYKSYLSKQYGEDVSNINTPFENYAQAAQIDARADLFINAYSADKGKRAARAIRFLNNYKEAFNIDPDMDTERIATDFNDAMNILGILESEKLSSEFSAEEKKSILKTAMISSMQETTNSKFSTEFQDAIKENLDNKEVKDLCK